MTDDSPLESELRSALAVDLPDPEAFLAGVTRRVREGERAQAEELQRLQDAPFQVQVAAGVLPPSLLSAGLAAGSLGGKKLGVKALPGLFSLPVVSLLMVVLGFGWGLRRLFGGAQPDSEAHASQAEAMQAWWLRNRYPALLCLLAFLVLVVLQYSEILMLLLLGSMGVAVLQIGQLARSGFAGVRGAGSLCSGLLYNLAFYGWIARHFIGGPPNLFLTLGVLALGSALCLIVSRTITWQATKAWLWTPIKMKHRDPVTDWALRVLVWPLAALVVVVAVLASTFVFSQLRPVDRGASALRESVQSIAPPHRGYFQPSLEMAAAVVEELNRTGEELPDLAALRRTLAVPADRVDHLGYQGRRLGYEFEAKTWDLSRGRLPASIGRMREYVEHLDFAEEGSALRLELAEHTRSLWPDSEHTRLEDLLDFTRTLEQLGYAEWLPAYREAVFAFLEAGWESRGGYSQHRRHNREAWLGILPFESEPNQRAVALLRSYGVPDFVDLHALRESFLSEIRCAPWQPSFFSQRKSSLPARLGLHQLESLPAYQAPSFMDQLVHFRNTIAALLLVLLCLTATFLAQRAEP